MLEKKRYMNKVKLSMKREYFENNQIETLGLIIQLNLNIDYMDSTVDLTVIKQKQEPTNSKIEPWILSNQRNTKEMSKV